MQQVNVMEEYRPGGRLSNLQLLSAVGQAVFGTYWHKAMGEALHVTQRTMSRWTGNVTNISDTVPSTGRPLLSELNRILTQHECEVAQVRAIMNRQLALSENHAT